MNDSTIGVSISLVELAKLVYEPLAVLAIELEFRPARAALAIKCEQVKNAQVWLLARRRGWCDADIADAQQEAVDWVGAAIDSYDTS